MSQHLVLGRPTEDIGSETWLLLASIGAAGEHIADGSRDISTTWKWASDKTAWGRLIANPSAACNLSFLPQTPPPLLQPCMSGPLSQLFTHVTMGRPRMGKLTHIESSAGA